MRTQLESGRALQQAREQMDALFRLVRPAAFYDRPIGERHRMIFYLGHADAFDWNLIARYALDVPAFHKEFDRLFAFGIDPPPGELPSDQPSDWPALAEVERYQHRTREIIDQLLDQVPEQLLHVAAEHRLMHAETFAYILHQLEYGKKVAAEQRHPESPSDGTNGRRSEFLPIPAGPAQLGMPRDGAFGWDTPFFWADRGAGWLFRGMFSEYPLPLDAPVYVTQEQAAAYAHWRGMRLPTEPEYHRAAADAPPSANRNFRNWDPVSVTADDDGTRRPMQLAGNGWEWTSTLFAPFPGFTPFPFYRNYSEPFFDGSHYVLKGASPRTADCFLRPSFRNWFRPSYPYVYATFRMVKS
jgi:hypothetical protein